MNICLRSSSARFGSVAAILRLPPSVTIRKPDIVRIGSSTSPAARRSTAAAISGSSCERGVQPRSPPTAAVAACENWRASALNRAPPRICSTKRSAVSRIEASSSGLLTDRNISQRRYVFSPLDASSRARTSSTSSAPISILGASRRFTSLDQATRLRICARSDSKLTPFRRNMEGRLPGSMPLRFSMSATLRPMSSSETVTFHFFAS